MVKRKALVACAAVVLSVGLAVSFRQPTFAQTVSPAPNPALNLNVVTLNFTKAQINPTEGNNQVVRAFVPTESNSQKCLATLNEQKNTSFPVALFC